ncbi:hypothetical protein C7271_11780 [filamentous cyanobacterium CCP5]|nr:hypothetical protein C7271_11780 [filamentous cyanobacterium CCP5]
MVVTAAGSAIALSGCAGFQLGPRPTRFLSIQPIQVCNDLGSFCADLAPFEAVTRKIWSQADIEITFLAPNRLLASRFLTIDSRDEFAEISFQGGAGAFGRNPLSSRNSGPISMWFVDEIIDGLADVFGLAWIDQNGILISDNILAFNGGIGRQDTVAHEIGHNLGLTHSNFGAGSATNLLTSGSIRAIPSGLGDVTPDGPLSRLTNDQINFARDSSLVTPNAGLPSDPPIFSLPPITLSFLDGDGLDDDSSRYVADYDAVVHRLPLLSQDSDQPGGEGRSRPQAPAPAVQPVAEPTTTAGFMGVLLWVAWRWRRHHG